MKDIENRKDIEFIVQTFYEQARQNSLLQPVFAPTDFEHHLPRVYNFWENMLFQTGNYNGGMMWVHLQTNERIRLSISHFEEWLGLWMATIDTHFAGKNADFMKAKALQIGQIMSAKMQHINQ
jgi:hemoglobin